MYVRLSGDREAKVGVAHIDSCGRTKKEADAHANATITSVTQLDDSFKVVYSRPTFEPKGTNAWLTFGETTLAKGVAKCSGDDNFCKRTGRRLAANRLVGHLRDRYPNRFSKEDRRAIFLAICPEFKVGKVVKA